MLFHVPDRDHVFKLCALVFLKIGWTKHPMLTVISVVISVSALVLTILLGDRSVKRELRRRFMFEKEQSEKEQFQKHAE